MAATIANKKDTVKDKETSKDSISDEHATPKGADVCAPSVTYIGDSCIATEVLESMIEEYNATHDDIINITSFQNLKKISMISYKIMLVKSLRHKLKHLCKTQACWVTLPFFKHMKNKEHWEMLHKYTFKPSGPKNTTEWLNTIHINEIFAQYEKVYKDFKFFGAVPRDFDDLSYLGIKEINYGRLMRDGIVKIGFIFNMDTHDMPGSHWVALFANLDKGEIDYVDSTGVPPPIEIKRLMKRIYLFCKSRTGNTTSMYINTTQHQKGNTECGVYSCNFILRLLKGESFHTIMATPIPDSTIKKCRFKYFK